MIEKRSSKFPRVLDGGYVVFVTASNSKSSSGGLHVRMGRSNDSVLDAIKHATQQLPTKLSLLHKQRSKDKNTNISKNGKKGGGNGFVWFQIDVVVGIKRLEDFNANAPILDEEEDTSNWFGLAMGWDDFVVLPNQVQSYCLIDAEGYLRWERVLQFLQKNHRYSVPSKADGWQQWNDKIRAVVPDYGDDAATIDVIDLFKTESIFIDLSHNTYHHAYHSEILPDPYYLTGGLRQYEYPTNTIMSEAIWKASLYAARAIDPKEGVLMGHYQPRSHHFEQSSLPWEEHANTLLGLARLHTHLSSSLSTNNNDNHSHNSNNNKHAEDIASAELVDTVLMSLKQGFSYMTKHLKGCYIPFPPLLQKKHRDEEYQCLLTISGKSRTARLADNAMLLAALVEYTDTTNDKTYVYWILELAEYIQGSFVEAGGDPQYQNLEPNSFVHSVQQPLYVKRGIPVSNQGDDFPESEAAFALLRLVHVFRKRSISVGEHDHHETTPKLVQWHRIAHLSVEQTITNHKQKQSQQFVNNSGERQQLMPDPWLMQAIAQLSLLTEKQHEEEADEEEDFQLTSEMVQYAVQSIHTISLFQVQDINTEIVSRGGLKTLKQSSASVMAMLANGLCPLHRLLATGISHKGRDDSLSTYLDIMVLATLYLLPLQIQPETSMFLPHDATRAIGGWRYSTIQEESSSTTRDSDASLADISTLHTINAANAIACTQEILKQESKIVIQKTYKNLFGKNAQF
eukprot:CAMPEP_0194144596 /NCGR_PEP_ID=MMETSP0152-20130528/13635_1 /TAXON_ID=1049557 /ORGANISM="Thalassiothrix antarctica, Strain L6-D1" /LENGTH=738 /DNA_ID=CAMNT_0038844521 /DNA_START=142 /DNA_END=2358 /DNA_ORIENTATION=-